MPVAKLKYSTPDAMKSEEGNDSLDTFIRQAVGKEPFYSFSRAGDSPVQWIQLLHALDQQDLPGWPLLSPIKVQMQKCDKCSREFCSTINYRRHMRVHRRTFNFDKDSIKNRDLLGEFWDKLSLDEVKEVVSFKDVQLEDVPGSSIVKSLTSLIRKPGFHSLPQVYAKAGSVLLDIIQSRPSTFSISSREFFSILDDASESTFLCAGTADSVQKYVFDGEAGKIGLEMKNLIACTCFLLEQRLVKAWLADKDAEALRCQKLLVDEEEAAQKRQAELMERRRKKKLRQREQRAKELTKVENTILMESTADLLDDVPSAESSSSLDAFHSVSHTSVAEQDLMSSLLEPIQFSNVEEDADTEAQSGFSFGNSDSGTYQHVEHRASQRNGHRRVVIARWKVPKSHRGAPNGFHVGQNPEVSKHGAMTKHGTHRDLRAAPVMNGNKVWTRKPKSETYDENLNSRGQRETINQPDQTDNCELLIGSISVSLANCSASQEGNSLAGARDNCGVEHPVPKRSNVEDRPLKSDAGQCTVNRSTIKLWRPVSRHGSSGPTPIQSDSREPEEEVITKKSDDLSIPRSSGTYNDFSGRANSFLSLSGEAQAFQFSSQAAEAFLAQRWKEAMATDHVKLVLCSEPEHPECPEIQNDVQEAAPFAISKKRSILGNAENRLTNVESSTWGTGNAKFRTKSEKGVKLKYIPKQRNIT